MSARVNPGKKKNNKPGGGLRLLHCTVHHQPHSHWCQQKRSGTGVLLRLSSKHLPFRSLQKGSECGAALPLSAVCPCSRDSGLLELMSPGRSAVAAARDNSGHLSTTIPGPFLVLLMRLNPPDGSFCCRTEHYVLSSGGADFIGIIELCGILLTFCGATCYSGCAEEYADDFIS